MTQDELLAIGCKKTFYGGWPLSTTEYYLPIGERETGTFGEPDERLAVDFYDDNVEPKTVWIILYSSALELPHITTIEQFKQLYTMLTGKEATK